MICLGINVKSPKCEVENEVRSAKSEVRSPKCEVRKQSSKFDCGISGPSQVSRKARYQGNCFGRFSMQSVEGLLIDVSDVQSYVKERLNFGRRTSRQIQKVCELLV